MQSYTGSGAERHDGHGARDEGERERALGNDQAGGRVTSGAAVVALRSAMQGAQRGWLTERQLRRAVRIVCVEGRRQGLRVEQLLVTVKAAWSSVADTRLPSRGAAGDDLCGRLVTALIDEFYAEERAVERPAQA
ncbi:MAG: hypothetical protein ACREON_19120 [Gemmatimonadaceae bacterium]